LLIQTIFPQIQTSGEFLNGEVNMVKGVGSFSGVRRIRTISGSVMMTHIGMVL
jgi:hypothetical protein